LSKLEKELIKLVNEIQAEELSFSKENIIQKKKKI
jgi:hypothetical protein